MQSDRQLFWQQFREAFRTTGAVAPSSRWLADELCRFVTPPASADIAARHFLEVGPGTGAVTGEIIRRLGPHDRLDLVEINPVFVARLHQRLRDDAAWQPLAHQVRVVEQDVLQFQPDRSYAVIVAGLPLNNFAPPQVADIFRHLASLLVPSGVLSYFEYWAVRRWKRRLAAGASRQRLGDLDRVLEYVLAKSQFKARRIWWNLPPAVVRHLRWAEAPAMRLDSD